MAEATLAALNLDTMSPSDLEARRRDIVTSLQTKYKGYDDPDVPMELLHELTVITSSLRRRNAGPPKSKATKTPTGPKKTLDDLNF